MTLRTTNDGYPLNRNEVVEVASGYKGKLSPVGQALRDAATKLSAPEYDPIRKMVESKVCPCGIAWDACEGIECPA